MKKTVRKILIISKYVFVYCSLLFIGGMIGFYGSRLIHFYRLEQKKDSSSSTIYEYLTREDHLMKQKLIKDKESYRYPLDADNNYIYFCGFYYRILYFNEKSIYAIIEKSVTNLKYGSSSQYQESNVKTWLENVFLANLKEEYLNGEKVTLLDKETYSKIGAKDSFVLEQDFWALDGENALIITEQGDVQKTESYADFLAVKPVVIFDSENFYIDGDGTYENPYLFENTVAETLEDVYVGEYIEYNSNVWRVIEKNENGVKVLSVSPIEKQLPFSSNSNAYSTSDKKGLGYYLNHDYLEGFNKDDLVSSKWDTGEYVMDYQDTKNTNVKAYVGALKVGDYFTMDVPNSYLLSKSGNYIYSMNEENKLTANEGKKALDIYPVLVLRKDLMIHSGVGYVDSPYVVGD